MEEPSSLWHLLEDVLRGEDELKVEPLGPEGVGGKEGRGKGGEKEEGGREGGREKEGESGGRESEQRRHASNCGHTFKSSSGAVTSGMVPSSSNP